MSALLHVEENPDCYGHVRLKHAGAKAALERLKIKLEGKLSLIYDSLLGLLTGALADSFQQTMGDALV